MDDLILGWKSSNKDLYIFFYEENIKDIPKEACDVVGLHINTNGDIYNLYSER